MITLQNVHKYFNKRKKNQLHVINDTNLEFKNAGLVALLGPSGSGKTTLLNVIGGLDKVNKGKIYINGQRITKKRVSKIDKIRNLNIGYIFQDYKLVDNMSVFDNIALVLKMIGIKDKKEIKTRVNYVLEVLNIYRYRNRYAGMLSGGERQRVGIARAIVKDPDIIIADEPTGNLDSRNTLEIMNIIKSISKNRLVILVTHENDLAKFYASRVIELQDGKIVNDYENEHSEELDYRLENNIYLKDFENHTKINKDNIDMEIYFDGKERVNFDVIVKNGNIYIKNNSQEKIEVIDQNSSIELVNDHYKKIDKSVYQKYEFNFSEVINKSLKKRYSSILNLFTLIINGFKKIFDYSFVKKLLLLGFFASSMFILLSLSRTFAVLNVEDKDFIRYNKDYLQIVMKKLNVKDYLEYEKNENVEYLLPGNSLVSFNINYNDYYQTVELTDNLKGSLSSIKMLNANQLKYGRMPENEKEIVIDKMVIDTTFANHIQKYIGINNVDELLNREVSVPNLKNFKIVGITDLENPSIYVDNSQLINIIANTVDESQMYGGYYRSTADSLVGEEGQEKVLDFNILKDDLSLKKGSWPANDYEVVVNYNNRDQMPLKKKIDTKVNGTKLTVVGYYTSMSDNNYLLVSPQTVKYNLITNSENITIYSKNKEETLNSFRSLDLNIDDSYTKAKMEYKEEMRDSVLTTMIVSGIMIGISLIEIFLMIRSSFLSRIKEIGIFRAIGVKKSDIYKMFMGEIIAITFIACASGIALMGYILKVLTEIDRLKSYIMINSNIILLAMLICLVFNLLVGLIPIFSIVRKTPAAILARHDLD